jgi:hypothetical protein
VALLTLSCSNCGAPMPREARWTAVKCGHCGAVVAPGIRVVSRKEFREALARDEREVAVAPGDVVVAGVRYRVLERLAAGERADVLAATRARRLGERVVVKWMRGGAGADARSIESEWTALAALAASQAQGAPHFTMRLPAPVAHGEARGADGRAGVALVVRDAPGFRPTVADVREAFPGGVDPRHAVWMWRRVLEVLGWVHRSGWAHGAIAPSHVVLNEREHGAILVSWSRARRTADGGDAPADIAAAAGAVRAVLGDDVPAPVRELVDACVAGASPSADAWQLKEIVAGAAERAFGPPAFVPFHVPRGR